jgi:hypothetical protein
LKALAYTREKSMPVMDLPAQAEKRAFVVIGSGSTVVKAEKWDPYIVVSKRLRREKEEGKKGNPVFLSRRGVLTAPTD